MKRGFDKMRDFFRDFSNFFYGLGTIIVVDIVILVISIVRDNNATNPDNFQFSVTPNEILGEYKENEVAASVKYEDKNVRITGKVESIDGDNDIVEILLEDDILMYRVVLVFTDNSEVEEVSAISVGDEIVVVGEVQEFEFAIYTSILYIRKCNFIA